MKSSDGPSVRLFLAAFFIAAVLIHPVSARADTPSLPLPELTIPRTATPIVIDGKFQPGKWNNATACTAFVKAFAGNLAHLQTTVYLTYDDNYIYLCVKNDRGKDEPLLKATGRRPDDENIVYDFANEIWFSPPGLPARTYQTMFNVYPGVLDELKIPSLGYSSKSWNGKWDIASSQDKDRWIIEARAPIKSFGVDTPLDGATWKALFAADILSDPDGFRAWAPGGAFDDIQRHGTIKFRANAPVFQFLDTASIFTGKPTLHLGVTAPPSGPANITVTARFTPALNDRGIELSHDSAVSNGAHEDFSIAADLSTLNLPKNDAGKRTGFCEVTARERGGDILYHQVFPFLIDGFVRQPPAVVLRSPYSTPFGVTASYAPLDKKLLVKVDRYYMEDQDRKRAVTGVAKLVDPKTGAVAAESPIAPFSYDYSDSAISLPLLHPPVQTEQDWAAHRNTEGAAYDLHVDLKDAAGNTISTATTPVKLLAYQFEWLPNDLGITDKVIPPFTPMKWRDGLLSMWNKTYRLNSLGLAERIVNNGAPQLSGPMRLIATVDGREQEVAAGSPTLVKLTEAGADLAGSAQGGICDFSVKTRAEFDGFVFNTMTVTPAQGSTLQKFSLVVTMPKSEAPCLVTTSGGWSSYTGWTPEKWDSRETSSGSRHGNFVPYIFLTDSDRGFCWFADNDEGWRLDPAQPTQELATTASTVTLRVNFVTQPTSTPTTFRYGWMVTPRQAQPHSWRACVFDFFRPNPKMTAAFFNDADRFSLWDYFSSPFPHDYATSKRALDDSAAKGVFAFVGNVAHSIGRYQDYKGRTFEPLDADWGEIPGIVNDGRVARSRGPNDFQIWHFNRWIEKSGLPGLYFDENYLSEDTNCLTGSAYQLPDGSVQPGYSYLGLRDFFKRLRVIFHQHGIGPPNLFLHTTGGQPVYAWMPDISMEGENVQPNGGQNDYPDAYPASRMRAVGMGRNLGCVPLIMGQAQRHFDPKAGPFLVHQFVGWCLLHDTIPEGSKQWETLAGELEIWRDDYRFIPYWKPGLGINSPDPDILASAHIAPGQGVLWLFNMARADKRAKVNLDLAKLGFTSAKLIAYDLETHESIPIKDGALDLPIRARLWRAIRLRQPRLLGHGLTFTASFKQKAAADESLGDPLPQSPDFPQLVSGTGVSLANGVSFATRHHVSGQTGAITFLATFDKGATGNILSIGTAHFYSDSGRLRFDDGATQSSAPMPEGTHTLEFSWANGQASVSVDSRNVLQVPLPNGMPIPVFGTEFSFKPDTADLENPPVPIQFGPIHGIMENLAMSGN